MDPISGIGQIVQILRRKLGERSAPRAGAGVASKTPGAKPARKASPEEIRRKIGARIQALAAEERQGPKAARVLVESIIAWEFGDQVMEDPEFAELSKDIVDAITGDDKSAVRLQTLLSQL